MNTAILGDLPPGAICRSAEIPRLYEVIQQLSLKTVVRIVGTAVTCLLYSRITVSVLEMPEGDGDSVADTGCAHTVLGSR